MIDKVKHEHKTKYKALLVLGRRIYKTQWIYDEIPEYINYGIKTLKLKMVLWNCNNKSNLERHKFVEIQLLVYR